MNEYIKGESDTTHRLSVVGVLILLTVVVGAYYLSWIGVALTSGARENSSRVSESVQRTVIKRAVLRVAILYEQWAETNGDYTGFMEDQHNASAMNQVIDEVRTSQIDAYYYTHSAHDLFVVKVRPKDSPVFYCFDSGRANVQVSVDDVRGDNYKSATTCTGVRM